MTSYSLTKLLVAAAASAFLLGACGGDADEAAPEVATLETDAEASGDAADAAVRQDESAEDLSPDEAALEFSQCMRDEGLDFPDLSVDAEGNIDLREAFQAVDRNAEGFREAADVCRGVLEQTGFGGGRRQALESTEIQDALVEFAGCVRDAGYDVGDLTLGGPPGGGGGDNQGQGQGADDDEAQQGQGGQQGQRQQGFGNRNARLAQGLGLDYDDPDVQETVDACGIIIEEAFAAAGIGQPNQNGG